MSLKPSRRNLSAVPKVKLGGLHPLPEPVEEMAIEEDPLLAASSESMKSKPTDADVFSTMNMLSSLYIDGITSKDVMPSLSRESSFDRDFDFDSGDDSDQGRSWQLSGDTGSSDFGNSVASFMSWTDDIEVETTKKVQELVDELERCMYGEESLDKLGKEASAECADWRSKFPHFRVRGTPALKFSLPVQSLHTPSPEIQEMADEGAEVVFQGFSDEDEKKEEFEEIIAIHGSYQEEPSLSKEIVGDRFSSESENSRLNTAESDSVCCDKSFSNENLKQKVKDFVMEQLFTYVCSEVTKSTELLMKSYSERTSSSRSVHPSFVQRSAGRHSSPRFLPIVDTSRAFSPVLETQNMELNRVLQVTPKSIHSTAKRTYNYPSLEPSSEDSDSDVVSSYFHKTAPLRHSAIPPTVKLPQSLSLHSANHVLAPMLTSEVRGYHSAADRRSRSMLNRKFSSMSSGQERFLKPLEEKNTSAVKATKNTTPRQVSAPSSPPNWSRHFTLPPIENLDSSKGLNSTVESKVRSIEVSPRTSTSAKQKVSLSPIHASNTIRIQGTGLSKLELAKQLLEAEEDLLFEKKGKLLEANGLCKYTSL